jgi:hypothetical protein
MSVILIFNVMPNCFYKNINFLTVTVSGDYGTFCDRKNSAARVIVLGITDHGPNYSCHDNHHNDTQHKGHISGIQHYDTAFVLSVAFYLLLC